MFQVSEAASQPLKRNASSHVMDRLEGLIDRIRRKKTNYGLTMRYYFFSSSRPRPDLPIFVAVHGIGRRAKDQARLFAPFMEALGGTLIAPVFDKRHFPGYQRLGKPGKGLRADLALQQCVSEVQKALNYPRQPVALFGYSGGGQFVHRFAMAYPRHVHRMAVAAPGWFTFPDMGLKFPHGIGQTTKLPDLNFDVSRFLKIPTLVLVGENDVARDSALNRSSKIDERQGGHRMARACRWVKTMKIAARRYHYDTPYEFLIVPNCGHSFDDCMNTGRMGWQIIRFLYGEERSPQLVSDDTTKQMRPELR